MTLFLDLSMTELYATFYLDYLQTYPEFNRSRLEFGISIKKADNHLVNFYGTQTIFMYTSRIDDQDMLTIADKLRQSLLSKKVRNVSTSSDLKHFYINNIDFIEYAIQEAMVIINTISPNTKYLFHRLGECSRDDQFHTATVSIYLRPPFDWTKHDEDKD